MKLFKILTIAALTGVMASCSNEMLTDDVQVINEKVNTRSVQEPLSVPEISKLMSNISIDDAIMKEVKISIERSLKYGMGETYRFYDILNPEESKILRTLKLSHNLSNALKEAYSDLETRQSVSLSDTDYFNALSNSKFMIRWPYFEEWNGIDKPIIGFSSEDGMTLYSPKLNSNGIFIIDTIPVSNDFLKENPIWVISESCLSNDDLPDFENGEFVNKNGTFFYSKYAIEKQKAARAISGKHGLYIEDACFKDEYEGGLKGNGEMEFHWQSLPNGIGKSQCVLYKNITKADIDEVLQLDIVVNESWSESPEIDNGLVVLEKDGGKDKTAYQQLRISTSNGVKTIAVPFPYERQDDIIMDRTWDKTSLRPENNIAGDGNPKKYYGKDNYFWVTLRVYE